MLAKEADASKFLMMTTLGADLRTIRKVAKQGEAVWLNRQLESPVDAGDSYYETTREIWRHFRARMLKAHGESAINGDGNNPALPYKYYFRMAWWQRVLSAGTASYDPSGLTLLRHRVAQALSELLVISDNSNLELDALGMASYYDILYRHAFGSYADMLEEVSMHPCMGVYLTHLNNRKADPSRNIHPDENYAREIMQLFTIGLYELNPDGTRVSGDIAAYDNEDIRELARVFTGLKASEYRYEWGGDFFPYNGTNVSFDDGMPKNFKTVPFVNMVSPMTVDEKYHDRGAKELLNGRIRIPAGQSGRKDVRSAVRALVAHPNTGPFVAQRMIQQLVKSNPSPSYVEAAGRAFGKKGDMEAMLRTILLHPEAKRPMKLKSPLLRLTQLLRAFNVSNKSGKLWFTGEYIKEMLGQHPLSSPTVFNFYSPEFAPHGPIGDAGKVAPEFGVHNASTSVAYVDMVYALLFGEYFPEVSTAMSVSLKNVPELDLNALQSRTRDRLRLDYTREMEIAWKVADHEKLVDRVGVLMTGRDDLPIKKDILEACKYYRDHPLWVVQTMIFMIAISSDYAILGSR